MAEDAALQRHHWPERHKEINVERCSERGAERERDANNVLRADIGPLPPRATVLASTIV
jgi:hypothetical protein